MTASPLPPQAEYARRQATYESRATRLDRHDAWLGHARLATFSSGLLLLVLGPGLGWLATPWLLVPLGVFVVLVVVHAGVANEYADARRRAAYYATGIQRIDHRLDADGSSPLAKHSWAPPDHPYAADLDLFGANSLFSLMCTARSHIGQSTLAQWLLAPASPAEIRGRQAAVSELRPHLDLREDLATMGDGTPQPLHPDILIGWAEAPPRLQVKVLRTILLLCNAVFATLVALWGVGLTGPLPSILWLAVQWGVGRWKRDDIEAVMAALQEPARELPLIAAVMGRFERDALQAPELQTMLAALREDRRPASKCLATLGRLADLYDAQMNQIFAPFAFTLLWAAHSAAAVESWRTRHGGRMRQWLRALGELEAITSLAGYAYEHPADPMPELVTTVAEPASPLFVGVGLGHPLLREAACVRNDVTLDAQNRLLVVSGSNMSGKSTLMRTVGVNAVLALAGAPVRAHSLRLTVLQMGATLRIQDSIQLGSSRFYAEITRLKQLVGLASNPPPLLFLLDEILHGTNSHDRVQGAKAVVQALLERGAIGIITTHDLALTRVVDDLGSLARNVHFRDELVDDKLRFDYRMQSGVIGQSNALALMRAVGLSV